MKLDDEKGVWIETIKLTLHPQYDSELIQILNRMPKGRKAKLIGDAILQVYGKSRVGSQETKRVDLGEAKTDEVKHLEPEPEQERVESKPKGKRKIMADTF